MKYCPIMSNTEIVLTVDVPRAKLVPVGCISKDCKFYDEEKKECILILQAKATIKIAEKREETKNV